MSYALIVQKDGYALVRRADGKYTVVGIDHKNYQVYAAMPGDKPKGGGTWYAGLCNSGIEYVSNGYSETYARRIFRKLTKEEK